MNVCLKKIVEGVNRESETDSRSDFLRKNVMAVIVRIIIVIMVLVVVTVAVTSVMMMIDGGEQIRGAFKL